ncbi:MAG: nucleotidyltransferase family protein [Brevefilum sp.]
MNALVLAGGILAKDDPLYSQSIGGLRCLLDIHGRPMVQWVLDALNGSDSVREIFIIGLPEFQELQSKKPLHYLDDDGGLFENISTGVMAASGHNSETTKVLLASGDLPAIQPQMIDWLTGQVAQNPHALVYYNVITKDTMNNRFPNANRTFVRLKDLTVCGGDMNIVDREFFAKENPLWNKLARARKNPLRQVSLLGFDSLILVALRMVTLQQAVQRVCKKLGIDGMALVSPYAEMGMDADKPYQLEILRKDLEDRS